MEETSLVLVEPRLYNNLSAHGRRHSLGCSLPGQDSSDLLLPAVDFPLQFNFGSPYSSSLTIFFDFDQRRSISGHCEGGWPPGVQ
jgi:hypothetical protein